MLSPLHGRPRAGRITLAALTLTLATQLVPLGGVVGPGKAAAATVCGSGEPLRGIDVSKYQGQIDWPAVAASGIKFGITRIGDGVNIPDWTFQPNYAAMRANGIIPGSYLFWRPGQDPVAQGNRIVAALASVGFDIGDLPPTIDVEVTSGLPPATIAERLQATVATIQNAIGVTPLVYTSPRFWKEKVVSTAFAELPLWIAHWGVPCPSIPDSWSSWGVWQTSSSGQVPGIKGPVDTDQSAGPSLPVYTGAPVLPPLPDMTVRASGPTTVTYEARAVGYRGLGIPARCQPASGSVFEVGTTTVTCSAWHAFGAISRSFDVTVRVPSPPAFEAALPAAIHVDATEFTGTPVSWQPVTALDDAGQRLTADCLPGPGTVFPIGDSLVICRASDSFGHQVAGSFTVSVGLTFPPFAG